MRLNRALRYMMTKEDTSTKVNASFCHMSRDGSARSETNWKKFLYFCSRIAYIM